VKVNHVICTTDILRIVEFHIENFGAIERRLRANGTTNMQPNDHEQPRTVLQPQQEDKNLDVGSENPKTITRRLVTCDEFSQNSVASLTRKTTLALPSTKKKVQEPQLTDYLPRRIFCESLLRKCASNSAFPSFVLFIGETGFTRDGRINFCNQNT